MSFKILVNLDKCEIKKEKDIFSNICININDFYFPEKDWNDFTTVILSWWKREILDLISGKIEHGELLFMEGSYEMFIYKELDNLKIHFIDNSYDNNKIVFKHETSVKSFLDELAKSYEIICNSNLLEDKYLKIRQQSYQELKDIIDSFKN